VNGARLLLEGLFDYAGLFPPAALPLDEVVRRFAGFRQGPHAALLGRLVVPVSALAALETCVTGLPPAAFGTPWRLSVLGSGGMEEDRQAIAEFNARHRDGRLIVDTVEVKVTSRLDVRRARALARDGWDVYCEPPDVRLGELLDAIAVSGLHAKLRAGGVTADAVPPASAVAELLAGCVVRGIRVKATAGLHHAVSGTYPLTYAADAARAPMHGYLNLLIAAGVAQAAGPAAMRAPEVVHALARILSLTSRPVLTPGGVLEWRDGSGPLTEGPLHELAPGARALLRSIGTCSFDDPVADARALALL
jgi:hypothetical protein